MLDHYITHCPRTLLSAHLVNIMEKSLVAVALLLGSCLAVEVTHGPAVNPSPPTPVQANSSAFQPSHPLVSQQYRQHPQQQEPQAQSQYQERPFQPESRGLAQTYFLQPPQDRYQSYQPILPSAYSENVQPLQVLNLVEYQPEEREAADFQPFQFLRQDPVTQPLQSYNFQQAAAQKQPERFLQRRAPESEYLLPSPAGQGYMVRFAEVPYPFGSRTLTRVTRNQDHY